MRTGKKKLKFTLLTIIFVISLMFVGMLSASAESEDGTIDNRILDINPLYERECECYNGWIPDISSNDSGVSLCNGWAFSDVEPIKVHDVAEGVTGPEKLRDENGNVYEVKWADVSRIRSGLERISFNNLNACYISDCDTLKTIHIGNVSEEVVIENCPGLTRLGISNSNNVSVTDSEINNLSLNGSINDINFKRCKIYAVDTAPNGSPLPDVEITPGVENFRFEDCENIKSVILSNGNGSFAYCTSISEVAISTEVTKLAESIFSGCTSLKSISFPYTLTEIGASAFSGCGLQSIYFNEQVTSIGSYAFSDCKNLYKITLPAATLGEGVLSVCTNLREIEISEGVTEIPEHFAHGCSNLERVKIPSSVEKIGNYAFRNCNLVSLTIPEGVTSLGYDIVDNCNNLKNLYIPSTLKTCPSYIFEDLNVENLTLGSQLYSISTYGLTGIRTLTLTKDVSDVSTLSLSSCNNLEAIYVDEDNPYYSSEDGVLFNKDKTVLICYPPQKTDSEYKIPDSVKTILSSAVRNPYLTKVELPASLKLIESFAFNCPLEELSEIPRTTEEIQFNAFTNHNLTDVYFGGTVAEWEKISFYEEFTYEDQTYVFDSFDPDVNVICTGSSLPPVDPKPEIPSNTYGILVDNSVYAVKVEGVTDEKVFAILQEKLKLEKVLAWDIVLTLEGDEVQPDGKVTIKIPVPEGYNPEQCKVYYINPETGELTDMQAYYEDGYFVFETDHFSIYSVAELHKHSYTSNTTKATCTSTGTKTYTCSCGDRYTETIAKKAHTIVTVKGKSATCTATGLTDGKKCSVCGTVTVKQTTIAKKAHTLTTVKGKAATCTATGLTEGKKCSVCGTVTVAQKTIAKKAHTLTTVKGKAATCTKTGLTDGKKCSVCGTVTVAQKTIAKKAHTYTTSTTKATLTKNGSVVKKCSVCGTVSSTSTIYYPKTITLSATTYTYNGKVKAPAVTVKNSKGNVLKKDTDYTVKYESGRKLPGKYTVTVTFKGKYSGTKALSFTITPMALSKVTATQTTTSVTLKWSKVTGATGYRVFQNVNGKWKTLTNTTKLTYTIKKLKAGTAYTFAVRPYTVDGKDTILAAKFTQLKTATMCKTPTLKLTSTKKGIANASWTNVAGETGYELYGSSKKSSGFKKLATTKMNVVKASKNKLTSKKTYYFKVRAYTKTDSGTVYSAWSAVKSIKIK